MIWRLPYAIKGWYMYWFSRDKVDTVLLARVKWRTRGDCLYNELALVQTQHRARARYHGYVWSGNRALDFAVWKRCKSLLRTIERRTKRREQWR